ncbi:thiopeptide-type bacteriocin biosynthesis protein [Streptomonospora salina]|uniref:Protein-L-isoaspartate(D-aspartate) O-methyltransferase n=1 Tax=Streptomonospora salina TaxID=104205 RepID=A0A841E6V7_9ACTN|nr:thiopeptide-type bacteriocin biosynthesis protein [Streptomonospora salina]MBB5998746.1 protein-L-isoaspartate(D-aspartate) O-methyltransferase [Streptomonospora salina]
MTTTTTPSPAGHDWHQANLWFDSWDVAEQTAIAHIGPALGQAEAEGLITGWWFTRKDLCWHLRYRPLCGTARGHLDELFGDLAARGAMGRWAWTLYEPETHAFGGPSGMRVAHTLFHADSRHLLDHLAHNGDRHRTELSLLVAGALLRGADQDFYERGDVWARVAAHRQASRAPTDTEISRVHQLATARPALEGTSTWTVAFQEAGAALAALAHEGDLIRGLRATLTHHVLFAWNRAGIPADRQALMAQAGADAVFHRRPPQRRSRESARQANTTPLR